MAECPICGAYKPYADDPCPDAWAELPKSKDVLARTMAAYALAAAFGMDLERWERHHLVICAEAAGAALTMPHFMALTAKQESLRDLHAIVEQQKTEIESLRKPRRGFFAGLRRLVHKES